MTYPSPKQTKRAVRRFLKGILGTHDNAIQQQKPMTRYALGMARLMLTRLQHLPVTVSDLLTLHTNFTFTDEATGKPLCCWGHRHRDKSEVIACISKANRTVLFGGPVSMDVVEMPDLGVRCMPPLGRFGG